MAAPIVSAPRRCSPPRGCGPEVAGSARDLRRSRNAPLPREAQVLDRRVAQMPGAPMPAVAPVLPMALVVSRVLAGCCAPRASRRRARRSREAAGDLVGDEVRRVAGVVVAR